MTTTPEKAAGAGPRAKRAVLLLGALQSVSVALYLGLARGVPSMNEALALLAIVAYPFAASALLELGVSPERVNVAAAAAALVCGVWICSLTGGIASPFAPAFLTLPSSAFSTMGARGVVALGATALAGLLLLALGDGADLFGPSPLEGDALERARALLFVHCVAVFVIVGIGVEAVRTRATRDLARERDRATVASRAKSAFLAMMSHELRTPLAGLLGALTLAFDETREPETRERLALATSSARSLRALLDDILDFSRIEAGRLPLLASPTAPSSVVEEVVALFTPAAGERGLELRATLDDGMRQGVLVDALRLRQVLSNLVGNSIKFTDAGEIEVVGTTVISEGACELRLAVRDTGRGMTEEQRSKLFQPFVQAHEREGGGGSGLGLVISRSIVELMGGSLALESEPGRGTLALVRLRLPTAELPTQPAASAPRRSTPPPDQAPLRVLVAEDSPVLQKLIRAMLQREGCDVVLVGDGEQLLDAARAGHFDLVLMDVHMPKMNGLDATRALREGAGPGARVMVYGLSGGAFTENERAAIEAGMDGYLVKPVEAELLLAVLDRARRQRSALERAAPTSD